MFDVIVVGARCAGSPTAMLLARAGHNVLLLDRATFPSDTLSTHLIHQPGVAALARWGLLDAVRATGCPPLDRATYSVADVFLDGCGQGVDGHHAAYAPRRYILDKLLTDGAAAAGVDVRERCRVTDLVRDESGRVIGVTGKYNGQSFTEHAPLVVGADGMRSAVARLADAPFTVQDPNLSCAYYSYWEDLAVAGLELYERPGGWVASVPTHDNVALILTYFPQSHFRVIRTEPEQAHREQVRITAPSLFERMDGKRQVEKLRGTGDQQNFFRQAVGPGWALVGDAGHHKDSITARGISDAFLQAEILTRLVTGKLDGPADSLDEALREYGEQRDSSMLPGYESTLSVARMEAAHEQRLALLRAVQGDQELTSTYFDMVAGSASSSALYTPKLLERLASE